MTGWLAVSLASLAGSLHCVAMCGGFVAVAATGPGQGRGGRVAVYHAARALAYAMLGAVAGAAGAALDGAAASALGVPRVAGVLMGLGLVGTGLLSLGPARGAPPLTIGRGPGLGTRVRRRFAPLLRGTGLGAAAGVGFLSALLPCAWLWSYVAIAASTADVVAGVLTMLLFWLGTVPALVVVGLVSGTLAIRLGRHAPRITAGAMIVIGLLALTGRLQMVAASPNSASAPCHEGP